MHVRTLEAAEADLKRVFSNAIEFNKDVPDNWAYIGAVELSAKLVEYLLPVAKYNHEALVMAEKIKEQEEKEEKQQG